MCINKEESISFVVEAKITQSIIIIEEGLTIEEIKEGLSSGTYITNIDHTSNKEEYISRVNNDFSLTSVAVIKSQQAEGDVVVYL